MVQETRKNSRGKRKKRAHLAPLPNDSPVLYGPFQSEWYSLATDEAIVLQQKNKLKNKDGEGENKIEEISSLVSEKRARAILSKEGKNEI